MGEKKFHPGWPVTIAGVGVNLMLGVLYTWGVISAALIDQLGWTATISQVPYMFACAMFAFSMVPGGRLQDRLGPKPVIMASAVMVGIGFIISGLFLTPVGLTIFFGIIAGMGIGTGYAAPTPAAVKWFSAKKRGLISGVVVSGFGLAPLYIAPLTNFLLSTYGIQRTFFILGGAFLILIMILAQFIKNPPHGYSPPDEEPSEIQQKVSVESAKVKVDYEWHEVLKTKQFYQLWIMFSFGTFAGLLIIGQLSKIGLEQAGMQNAYILVGIYAIFNFAGRIGCGVLSDKFGRMRTLLAMFVLQVIVYAFFATFTTPPILMMGVSVVGFTFGGMLTLFPSATVDYFGIKNFGMNYGMVITAWGIGGVLGPLLGGIVRDVTGTYGISYLVSGVLSATGAILTLITKPPKEEPIKEEIEPETVTP
ncbi:L-lactate MFS transporter [Tindallia californiensis]|uniref:MFS transporter, OFA family, oxalate/formate antiporter n=1 Tax=Tindallia californiensis TaxID=159292 RepID=A0A1H3JNG3_9FIRM|nr:OFA family MFS transporter [Tindallia californiensis]SDY41530.1 MFS transporter, OFA family, oxalate/formate antiporter [Tindallia californiensis]